LYVTIPTLWRHGSFGRALIAGIIREWIMPFVSSHWRVLKKGDPIIWCYMQLQWPNSTLRYTIFNIHSVAILSLKHIYVNRKITSYIYLFIFTKSLWLHVKHCIALTKRESVRRILYCNYRSGVITLVSTSTSDHEKQNPIIWCYMQLQWPNSTLRYTVFNIH
jgi:hypothetical protein